MGSEIAIVGNKEGGRLGEGGIDGRVWYWHGDEAIRRPNGVMEVM